MDGRHRNEQLPAELAVPADLLWNALTTVLAVMPSDYRTDCHADCCLFACAAFCAASAEIGTAECWPPLLTPPAEQPSANNDQ